MTHEKNPGYWEAVKPLKVRTDYREEITDSPEVKSRDRRLSAWSRVLGLGGNGQVVHYCSSPKPWEDPKRKGDLEMVWWEFMVRMQLAALMR